MSAPQEHVDEAEAVADVYRWALAYVGLSVIADTLKSWSEVPPSGTTSASWLAATTKLIGLRRNWMVKLALTSYRLHRALLTGATIHAPDLKNENVTLDNLRNEFEEVVDEIALHAGASAKAAKSYVAVQQELDDIGPEPDLPDMDHELVEVEKLDADIQEMLDELEAEAEKQLIENLAKKGPARLAVKNKEMDTSKPADEVDAQRKAEHKISGDLAAGESQRVAANNARHLTYHLGEKDKRVIGWIRYSKTGTPCPWCAMLLSRGFTEKSGLYKSSQTAGGVDGKTVGLEFHPNCNCVAEPIYSKDQLQSDRYELNRYYAEMWPKVTAGYGGKDALNAWRRHFRASQKKQTDQAQVAA